MLYQAEPRPDTDGYCISDSHDLSPRAGRIHLANPLSKQVRILLSIDYGRSEMREIATSVVRELGLDYAVTLVSGGASRNYEIVMWDKPHNTYFSIRLDWDPRTPREAIAGRIKQELRARLDTFRSGRRRFGERSPSAPVLPKRAGRSA